MAAEHLLGGKQGDVLRLPGVKCFDRRTKFATHVSDFPCMEYYLQSGHQAKSGLAVNKYQSGRKFWHMTADS